MKQEKLRSLRPKLRSPGKPPVLHRAERWAFWKAVAHGHTSKDAAAIAGVAQAGGTRWFRQCGGMPPSNLAPSAAAPTGRYLCLAEREQIALAVARGEGGREIARQFGRSPSTISRELRRNAASRGGSPEYRARTARRHADRAAMRPKPAKLLTNPVPREYVQERLAGNIATPGGESIAGPRVEWKGRRHGPRQARRWSKATIIGGARRLMWPAALEHGRPRWKHGFLATIMRRSELELAALVERLQGAISDLRNDSTTEFPAGCSIDGHAKHEAVGAPNPAHPGTLVYAVVFQLSLTTAEPPDPNDDPFKQAHIPHRWPLKCLLRCKCDRPLRSGEFRATDVGLRPTPVGYFAAVADARLRRTNSRSLPSSGHRPARLSLARKTAAECIADAGTAGLDNIDGGPVPRPSQ